MTNTENLFLGTALMAITTLGLIGCKGTSDEAEKALRRTEKAEQKVDDLERLVAEMTDKKKDMELEIMRLQEELEKARTGITQSTQSNAALGSQLQDLQNQSTSVTEQLALAKQQLAEKDRQIHDLEALNKELTAALGNLDTVDIPPTTDQAATADTPVDPNMAPR